MEQQNSSEELDIAQIMNKIRDGYHSVLVWLYNILQFFISRWIILFVLIIIGVIAGFFLQNSDYKKKTTLLVQVNFNAANYVYDAIEQLEKKISEKDTIVLKQIGIYNRDTLLIKSVEIEPVVDIMEIIRSDKGDERNIEILMQQLRVEEDILTSEVFIPKYKLHKIDLLTSANANEKTVEKLLYYLNDNAILNTIKDTVVQSTKKEIAHNEQSINTLDSIVKAYALSPSEKNNSNQIYFNNVDNNNSNIHLLFEQKNIIIEENEKLKVELLKYDSIVQLMNKPMLQDKKGFFDNKLIAYPLMLVFLFILFSIVRYFYLKAKKLSKL